MSSKIQTIKTKPFKDQEPGTSGLRKKTAVFMEPNYLENFVTAVLNVIEREEADDLTTETLVVGGDGRYFNRAAIQTIIQLAAAKKIGRVLVARDGILSTPAASAVIRRRKAMGGFILSASHNPGGREQDFGIKYNNRSGAPSSEKLTKLIYEETLHLSSYLKVESDLIDLSKEHETQVGETQVEVFNSLEDYTALMEEFFDFDLLRTFFDRGGRLIFDAMHAVTGPYAKHIFENLLGAPEGTVMNGEPLEDFGGCHPDPNLVHASELVRIMHGASAPEFGAASDGDGDRNMVLGPGFFISPGDSLAVMAEHVTHCVPGYEGQLFGVARSMPTCGAVDLVARERGIPCYETPTGWKFFGNLMDAGLITLCGEESFGTGSSHVREKDGLWAVLVWLSILAKTGKTVHEIVQQHWTKFGRFYFQRHDYEGLKREDAEVLFKEMRVLAPNMVGQQLGAFEVQKVDEFHYKDPVDHLISERQGMRIFFRGGYRVVLRLSGTGTSGSTLRIYYEKYERKNISEDPEKHLLPLVRIIRAWCGIQGRFERDQPDVVT